ncbi:unnamed protein product [Gongylonema pulchrum]|uniref:sn-1-specific diacylglycerol lipase ABHD11 n=1 Tax=Gongylonema pulchrum TaxID=637853 RepID=A0A183CYA9_9BILA|nr:unnamed protein product [Gongylonema pulchrum]
MWSCRRHTHRPVELAFDKYGDKLDRRTSPLIILHGIFGHKSNWQSIARTLQQRLGTIIFTVDLRNHGDSPWCASMTYPEMTEDVRHFINEIVQREIGVRSCIHLLGHSMGGKIAMRLALENRDTDLIRSLIIEDITPRSYSLLASFPRMIEAMKHIDLTRSRAEIERELAATVSDRTTRLFLMMNLVTDRGRAQQRWRLNLDSIGRHLHELRGAGVPNDGVFHGRCLFVSGALSQYVLDSDHPAILERFPNAEFSVIPRASHWVHAGNPDDFVEAIVKFIRSVESAP